MTDDIETPRTSIWLRCLAAATLLAIGFIAFSAWTDAPSSKVAFSLSAGFSDQKVTIGGAVSVIGGAFEFQGNRISFSGRIEGDWVSIDGRVANGDRSRTKSFAGGGAIVEGRSSVTVKSSEGSRLGTLKLDFNPA